MNYNHGLGDLDGVAGIRGLRFNKGVVLCLHAEMLSSMGEGAACIRGLRLEWEPYVSASRIRVTLALKKTKTSFS